jgi:Tannase-like family of unknown function (DUF6351)
MRERSASSRTPIRTFFTALVAIATLGGLITGSSASPSQPKLRETKEHSQSGSNDFRIATMSARNHLVSGGDVLVQIDVAPSIPLGQVNVTRNGDDVTAGFKPASGSHSLMGLVAGLNVGDNVLTAGTRGSGGGSARLKVTNFPITGPIISGPHEQPFFCTTQTFAMPVIGGNLGPALDADCSIATRVDYVYRSTANTFKPLKISEEVRLRRRVHVVGMVEADGHLPRGRLRLVQGWRRSAPAQGDVAIGWPGAVAGQSMPELYVNGYSEANKGGEIRAQLKP